MSGSVSTNTIIPNTKITLQVKSSTQLRFHLPNDLDQEECPNQLGYAMTMGNTKGQLNMG